MQKIVLLASFLIILTIAGYLIYTNSFKPSPATDVQTVTPTSTPLVGADRDEHGCIGSAGYSWCEPKNKCLRVWEEACYESVSQEIQHILAKKYNRPADEVNITVSKQDGKYASGSVLFGEGGLGEGGVFLARKVGNMWEVVFDGNGSVDCTLLRKDYGFPDSILKPNFCD
jgi:hypothetical protein